MKTTRLKPLAHDPPAHCHLAQRWPKYGRIGGLHAALVMALAAALCAPSLAADAPPAGATRAATATLPAASASAAKNAGDQMREAIQTGAAGQKRLTLVINGKEKKYITMPASAPPESAQAPAKSKDSQPATHAKASANSARSAASALAAPRKPGPAAPVDAQASRQYLRTRAAALTGDATPTAVADARHDRQAPWRYEGANGPQSWGKLKPDFNLCANGKRQSPINIDESVTLQGPAEPLQFNYKPSGGSVVNNGHTIQVDLDGDNTVTVRGSSFKLLQFNFHHPSEERVNSRGFAMATHLVHQNAEGQLAVVALMLEPGVANDLINKVWTHMPLDAGDRVRLPLGLIDMNELLPKDQRYYQFMGSLSTPPCTEGVLWLVLKQPTPVSREQIRLFSQLFPNNARPVQPLNGRAVRDAQ